MLSGGLYGQSDRFTRPTAFRRNRGSQVRILLGALRTCGEVPAHTALLLSALSPRGWPQSVADRRLGDGEPFAQTIAPTRHGSLTPSTRAGSLVSSGGRT